MCMAYFNVAPSFLPSFLSSLSRLELLSTITEIRGYLRIQGWGEETFPYLRNLRRIGSPNGTADNSFCNDGQRCEFSFLHFSSTDNLIFAFLKNSSYVDDFSVELSLNLQLQQIDLSSLETISGGGVLFFRNPQLCYVGNFSTYLDNQTTQHQCIISPFRRDPQGCSESCVVPPLLRNVTLMLLIAPTSSLSS